MRFIPTRIHGYLDYLVGLLLIGAPWLFGFDRGGPETWIPVALGAAAIIYSLFTDYELGAVRKISMPIHLTLDVTSGLVLALSPWIFNFSGNVAVPHLAFGLLEIAAGLLTEARVQDRSTAER
jgi:hypothetical protein